MAHEGRAISPESTGEGAPSDEALAASAISASARERESVLQGGNAAHPDRGPASAHDRHRSLTGFPKLHPPMVHFPIAMLVGAALAEILLMSTGRATFRHAARFCVRIGALSAVPTAALGWFFGGLQLADEDWTQTAHRWLGTVTASWAIVLLAIAERRNVRRAYRLAVFVGAALVMATGFFGGALVYGLDHYAW